MEERAANADKGLKVLLEFIWLGLVATCVKLLLVRSYRSTDFEVHRHWAALTYSLPLREWYFDETSPWTLDYPPIFAYFERFVSVFANLVDPKIVQLRDRLNYDALSSIYFQRITVIVTDLCLFIAAYQFTKRLDYVRRFVVWVLIIASPGLLIVDHMHFQYSAFLLGLLLLSLSFLEEGRDLEGGFFFAALLYFKHLYAVAAPVYFVYLLRHYCRGGLVSGFYTGFSNGDGCGIRICSSLWAFFVPWSGFYSFSGLYYLSHDTINMGKTLCSVTVVIHGPCRFTKS